MPSSYKCPTCKVLYCSLKCFKTHNEDCTEAFYQKNIEQKLKSQRPSEEIKAKTRKILDNERESYLEDTMTPLQEKRYEDMMSKEDLRLEDLTFDEQ